MLTFDFNTKWGAKYANCQIHLSQYLDGSPAWYIVDEDGKPIITATVCIDQTPAEGCVFIKNYSENAGVWNALADAGIIEREPVSRIPSGFIEVLEARVLKPELL